MNIVNEHGIPVDYSTYETREVALAKQYVKSTDRVLELGARYGGVSVTTNKILDDKYSHYVVEPDSRVWLALYKNKVNNNCHFNIIKGTISNKPQQIVKNSRKFNDNNDWATYTIDGGDIPNYPLPNVDFNVLIADCEGFLETFYNENTYLFKSLRLIIFERDRPDYCNYDRLVNEFINLGFKCVRNEFHSVFIK